MILLVTGPDGRWHPGIGDPTFLGWLTVVAYALAALLAVRALRTSRRRASRLGSIDPAASRSERHLATFWLLVAFAMTALGINKQLDLQTYFIEVLRDAAHRQGWYEARRKYQLAFVIAVAIVGGAGTLALALVLRRSIARIRLAVIGLGTIASFVVVRAASFHHVDAVLFGGPLPINSILELGGIVAILVGARRFVRAHAPARAR